MRMPIDGTGDDAIQIQGLSEKYTFTDADGGPSGEDEGADPAEQVALASLVPEEPGEEDGGEEEENDMLVDSSDEEDDTALVVDTVGEPPPAPTGFKYVTEPPDIETDEEALNLVGKNIMHAWDTPGFQGWFMGRISSRGCSARDLRSTPSANFVVTYDKKVTKKAALHGRVASTLTPVKYGPKEWWLLLEPIAG